jgi:polyhydroxybutyrate depolymerase
MNTPLSRLRKVTAGILGGIVASALCSTTCNRPPTSPSESVPSEGLVVQGVTRTYLLHIPATFQSSGGALVIALPGRTETASFFQGFTNLNAKADQEGFAVAYADGLFQPASGAVNWAYYRNDYVDDVSFLRQLIATLQARLRVNPGRVFVTGFSSGGFMAYRAAVELPDIIAAVGVVGGRLFREEGGAAANVPPARGPVSVVMMQGEFDTPYCGGFETSPIGRAYNASQDETFDYWTGPNGNSCSTFDSVEPLCRNGQQTAIASKTATNCRGNTQVTFYKLIGGDHFWYTNPMNVPGQVPFNPQLTGASGVTTNDILWSFFAAHSR